MIMFLNAVILHGEGLEIRLRDCRLSNVDLNLKLSMVSAEGFADNYNQLIDD